MARQRKYIAGYKTGELTVVARVGDSVFCICSCGRTPTILLSNIGRDKSCGHLKGNRSHGKTSTSLYGIWRGILTRCNNRRHPSYETHGLRGIKCLFSCFEEFQFAVQQDLGQRPDPKYTVDRIRGRNYERFNLQWLDKAGQRLNQRPRRTHTQIDFDTRLTLAERDAWDMVAMSKVKFGDHNDYLVAA